MQAPGNDLGLGHGPYKGFQLSHPHLVGGTSPGGIDEHRLAPLKRTESVTETRGVALYQETGGSPRNIVALARSRPLEGESGAATDASTTSIGIFPDNSHTFNEIANCRLHHCGREVDVTWTGLNMLKKI